MDKYRVAVCREVWGYIVVEANSDVEAQMMVSEGEHESDFTMLRYGENESVYSAVLIVPTE